MDDIIHWLAATQLHDIGPVTLRRCLNHFGSWTNLFAAGLSTLKAAGFTDRQCAALRKPDWQKAETTRNWISRNDCHLLTYHDPAYPPLLREIHSAPLVLYVRGDVRILPTCQLAMVGSRHATPGGCETASLFARDLVQAGLVITSGLALGIDGASHRGALQAGGTGKTIAVMGTGLQHIYPAAHKRLAGDILAGGGAIVSELPPDMPPKASNFPLRNRLISGLSCGVLVVEAARRSGSLITARFALEQNRDVFAMPGSIHNPQARGCHDLIRQGAKLVDSVQDILTEVSAFAGMPSPGVQKPAMPVASEVTDPLERKVLQQVDYQVTARDVIIVRAGLTAAEVSSILLALELSGQVESVPGGYARRAPAGEPDIRNSR